MKKKIQVINVCKASAIIALTQLNGVVANVL